MTQRKYSKIWRATKEGVAGMMVQEKAAFLIGDKNNFVVADDQGVSITGKAISLNTGSENIRKGGLFTEQNNLVQMIPTTLTTPMPNNIPSPGFGIIASPLASLPFFIAMLNGFA